ncbi:hypothetical protein NQZ68_028325 [Dissostichus eleginoides]|nr:hypothetical protein NQZ68_028325 [Dissostichus eleginoides]
MDPTEDLSARVLLTHILSTETPRTPITRSASQQPSTSATRSSSRLRNKNAVPQTPTAILKHSQIHKLRESISRPSLNTTRKRTRSVSFRLSNMPAANSMLLEDGETQRHLLMNILPTMPVCGGTWELKGKVTPRGNADNAGQEKHPPGSSVAVKHSRAGKPAVQTATAVRADQPSRQHSVRQARHS